MCSLDSEIQVSTHESDFDKTLETFYEFQQVSNILNFNSDLGDRRH